MADEVLVEEAASNARDDRSASRALPTAGTFTKCPKCGTALYQISSRDQDDELSYGAISEYHEVLRSAIWNPSLTLAAGAEWACMYMHDDEVFDEGEEHICRKCRFCRFSWCEAVVNEGSIYDGDDEETSSPTSHEDQASVQASAT